MALPLSAGRMMMFSFCWRGFKDVDCFLVMFLLGGFALRMIELRSVRMVSASSVFIPANVVSILAIKFKIICLMKPLAARVACRRRRNKDTEISSVRKFLHFAYVAPIMTLEFSLFKLAA